MERTEVEEMESMGMGVFGGVLMLKGVEKLGFSWRVL